ncbi:hypothetical protein TAMA11512_15150 [Selenomonas sp. TAMA-11512]|uniref:class I SAM-dependent methyltransferase n=1 Tax=Selenomonas sp. TAMA-11512 TaxID=3095337 RepID=UPI00308AA58F|nr:hypothetical protein TAMA11512_15150 [Selenomonas sp. TAMA-11512]
MKPNYKNWVPKGMIFAAIGATGISLLLCILFGIIGIVSGWIKTVLSLIFLIGAVGGLGVSIWLIFLYCTFSYDGKRQMSKQIIEGVSTHVKLPDGGKGLDIGCGSGALTIACAKRNPNAFFIGIDRWGREYSSFNKTLCESNADAEGVSNVRFERGDAKRIDFPGESFDAVTSNYVYHNIFGDRQALLLETLRVLKKGGTFAIHDIFSKACYGDMQAFVRKLKDMGYEDVRLIDTTDGLFMSKSEARWMALAGSGLLVGKK